MAWYRWNLWNESIGRVKRRRRRRRSVVGRFYYPAAGKIARLGGNEGCSADEWRCEKAIWLQRLEGMVAIGKRLADEAATKNRNRLFQIARTYLLTHSPTYRSTTSSLAKAKLRSRQPASLLAPSKISFAFRSSPAAIVRVTRFATLHRSFFSPAP